MFMNSSNLMLYQLHQSNMYLLFLESTCLMRQCCGPARALNLHITDNNNQVGNVLHYPFALNSLHLSLTLHVVLASKVNKHSLTCGKYTSYNMRWFYKQIGFNLVDSLHLPLTLHTERALKVNISFLTCDISLTPGKYVFLNTNTRNTLY